MDATNLGLLEAIRAAPDDLAPRLIYADFLEEHGHDERAAAIRKHLDYGATGSLRKPFVRKLLGVGVRKAIEDDNLSHGKRSIQFRHSGTAPVMISGCVPNTYRDYSILPEKRLRAFLWSGFITELRCTQVAWRQFGPWIAREQPLAALELFDVECSHELIEDWIHHGQFWWWRRELNFARKSSQSSVLYGPLYDHLDGFDRSAIFQKAKGYRDYRDAMKALYRAALAYARQVDQPEGALP